jgi:hypothetical protein
MLPPPLLLVLAVSTWKSWIHAVRRTCSEPDGSSWITLGPSTRSAEVGGRFRRSTRCARCVSRCCRRPDTLTGWTGWTHWTHWTGWSRWTCRHTQRRLADPAFLLLPSAPNQLGLPLGQFYLPNCRPIFFSLSLRLLYFFCPPLSPFLNSLFLEETHNLHHNTINKSLHLPFRFLLSSALFSFCRESPVDVPVFLPFLLFCLFLCQSLQTQRKRTVPDFASISNIFGRPFLRVF